MKFLTFLSLTIAALAAEPRITVPLDGTWQITDSTAPDPVPASFDHQVPVPGMANLATPVFPDVDRFYSREYIGNQVRRKLMPESDVTTAVGTPHQNRTYFWYARTFRAPARKQVAILKIAKAQFGTAVWLNGKKIGEHTGCFTAGYLDVTGAVDWQGENRLVIRIGAHPLALPPSIVTGTDFEKSKWTPGIYDSVSLILADNPMIERIQVAPRLAGSEIVVQTVVKNYGAKPASCTLAHRVRTWQSKAAAGAGARQRLTLAAGEEKTVTETIRIPNATLDA